MTLFRNCAVLRLMCGFPFAPIQILTGDTREGCHARRGRLLDDRRSFPPKSRIERRFESSPESRGSQPSGVLLVLFVQAKRIKPFPLREIRGFTNLESAHPNNNFPLTKLNPFQKGVPRFSKPRISAHKQNFAQCQLNPFAAYAAFAPPFGGIFCC